MSILSRPLTNCRQSSSKTLRATGMANAPRTTVSDAEREVLKVLWEAAPLAVRDVVATLTERGQAWTRSTVITLLQRLERKGYVDCDKSQSAFIFRAAVSREQEMH